MMKYMSWSWQAELHEAEKINKSSIQLHTTLLSYCAWWKKYKLLADAQVLFPCHYFCLYLSCPWLHFFCHFTSFTENTKEIIWIITPPHKNKQPLPRTLKSNISVRSVITSFCFPLCIPHPGEASLGHGIPVTLDHFSSHKIPVRETSGGFNVQLLELPELSNTRK